MPFGALFWPDMPFSTPFLALSTEMPCNTPKYFLYFAYAEFFGQGAKKKKIKTSRPTRALFMPLSPSPAVFACMPVQRELTHIKTSTKK
jgi:hypothetical protein